METSDGGGELEQRDRSCWWKGRKGERYARAEVEEDLYRYKREGEGGGRRQRRRVGRRLETRRLIGTTDRCGRQLAELREKMCGGWHPKLTPYTEYR
jgi:hypothetical protein